ncbi:hypothetical protein K491DRAFT_733379 [Lophiostoma macrostomum CBS 122681]|uniref:Uncharacterized protein n=1 Tax=Lophiostoma macrostomum CBS 122681 TaxID=1314788 RepID=A0A6A6SPG6_9PLEO|nr:hypothetical protein K491DRAFT_733379 [Lophiostoma macrostomum CBS 122681]
MPKRKADLRLPHGFLERVKRLRATPKRNMALDHVKLVPLKEHSFDHLNLDVRHLVYDYMTFRPFSDGKDSAGLYLSCRQARHELQGVAKKGFESWFDQHQKRKNKGESIGREIDYNPDRIVITVDCALALKILGVILTGKVFYVDKFEICILESRDPQERRWWTFEHHMRDLIRKNMRRLADRFDGHHESDGTFPMPTVLSISYVMDGKLPARYTECITRFTRNRIKQLNRSSTLDFPEFRAVFSLDGIAGRRTLRLPKIWRDGIGSVKTVVEPWARSRGTEMVEDLWYTDVGDEEETEVVKKWLKRYQKGFFLSLSHKTLQLTYTNMNDISSDEHQYT